ncbi:hypothetical protein P280DRAFT_479554 [Massarina eburnea CBS 473.64]|uniref:Uncharacterized protein n=1 Tax=Massarina eburnea CBS 473.64 TaxID=1395130 RepID=A0A6A6RZX3_9PLEO|nr:hypothetical protein P280DRAFT_479554 [Massarina eburnea CBS 473.64]
MAYRDIQTIFSAFCLYIDTDSIRVQAFWEGGGEIGIPLEDVKMTPTAFQEKHEFGIRNSIVHIMTHQILGQFGKSRDCRVIVKPSKKRMYSRMIKSLSRSGA